MKFRYLTPDQSAAPNAVMHELDRLIGNGELHTRFDEIAQLFADLCQTGDALVKNFVVEACQRKEWPQVSGAQSFRLLMTDNIIVRLNLWYPPDNPESPLDSYRRYLSIDELHNHDFEFFTSCVFGPGYTTTLYHDPNHHPNRQKGDFVQLEKLGTKHVQCGDIVFFEAGTDYHEQHWPPSFSVTLNLISRHLAREERVQYVLDTQHRVKTIIDTRKG